MLTLHVAWWALVVRSLVIYAMLFIGLRIFGKREIGQFTIFDLVLILLVANAVQPAMTGPDTSLVGGVIIIATLLGANQLVALLRRIPQVRRLLETEPTEIARDGKWNLKAVKREGLDLDDCEMAVREHGVESVKDVKLATLEPDGTISIVPKENGNQRAERHRVRYVRRG